MAKPGFISTTPVPERALLVGVDWRVNSWPIDRSLDELERLAHTAGAEAVAKLTQRLDKQSPSHLLGLARLRNLFEWFTVLI